MQKNITSGVLGDAIDVSGSGQGKGFPALVGIAFTENTTATANPDIQFALETSDAEDFSKSTVIPLALPLPLKKADMPAGTVLVSPLPLNGLKRYLRLRLGTDSAINCMGIKAGIVLDAPMK